MRGHGESSHSPTQLYGIEQLVEDVHELVVRLSLNGRDWGGAWTRPWVLVGRGTGAAVATAYAARHPGRVAGLVLWDFDPEWPKDRLNFYPYQAAHFTCQQAIASFFNDKLQLQEDGKYLAILFVNRAHLVDPTNDYLVRRARLPYESPSHHSIACAHAVSRRGAARPRSQPHACDRPGLAAHQGADHNLSSLLLMADPIVTLISYR